MTKEQIKALAEAMSIDDLKAILPLVPENRIREILKLIEEKEQNQ